jgi:alkanesulfonate monooxygenase SsuD/methylene tetrahydromethanopterin reductase-like flavin-dependent oxidoreductase (luciferase family)
VPIHIGGHSGAAARRAGRLGDGFIPGEGDLDALLREMRGAAEAAGRDPSAIEVTAGDRAMWTGDPLAAVEALAAKGVHRVAVPGFVFALAPEPAAAIAEFGEQVIAASAGL